MVLFDNVLHRVRFSKFMAIVSQEFDKPCVDLIETLLQHGRLSLEQIFDGFRDRKSSGGMEALRGNIHKLVMARYVERCPVAEPFLALPSEEEAAPAKRRGAKSAKIFFEPETLEQRVLAAAVPPEAIRFSVELNPEISADTERDENNSPSNVGEKRKHDALESGIDGGVADKQVVLWRVNFEEFIRRLRHKLRSLFLSHLSHNIPTGGGWWNEIETQDVHTVRRSVASCLHGDFPIVLSEGQICVENVRARLDDEAATVFSAMLDASRSEEKKLKIPSSVPLSVESIYQEVIKSEKDRTKTLEHIIPVLDQLSSSPPFIRVIGDSYIIDFKHIIELAQTDEVESIVLKKYGKDAYRIFRLLSKAGRLLETDKVLVTPQILVGVGWDNLRTTGCANIGICKAILLQLASGATRKPALWICTEVNVDSVFVEKKETANILSKMWQGDYLQMEKLVAGPTHFLLWKVNMINIREHVLDDMFHAALNLSLRVAYELEQQKEILNLGVHGPVKEKYEKLRKVRFLLESSRMKLDDAVMIFHDF
ncbi:unnamed protein product [Dovyalis caffra]|uniref:DNA-directed RNA polymerase III subunit RPC3 n=1 Tax=Dovyalis caffra TaxID=77055 RepID=A0AAV1RKS7_9ROSI|nr:unnamed protein product [Dovyalis caffra]